MAAPEPTLPDYRGACIANLVPGLRTTGDPPEWIPSAAVGADRVVLLVLDGLGWLQLRDRPALAPTLCAMEGAPITSVVPTTTATALTSITTGAAPAVHGVVGYRVRVGPHDVLNVLRWRTPSGDARQTVEPAAFQVQPVFGGSAAAVVTRAEFESTGFTLAHLAGTRQFGWRMPSTLAVEVGRLLRADERFVYAYYDGIDKVAHEHGFGAYFDAELRSVDRLVADVVAELTPGAALVVTADHGQVQVDTPSLPIPDDVLADTALVSGEGRFRWLHARPGCRDRLATRAAQAFGDVAWVHTTDELEAGRWFGGRLSDAARSRLGDVAVIAHQLVAVSDPADPGELALRCRHGSVTPEEMFVPLLAVAG